MITNATTLASIREGWGAVKKLIPRRPMTFVSPIGGIYTESPTPDEYWNLPFVLAYAVLDEVLSALIDQGAFACRSWLLGVKLEASKEFLPWQDFDLVSRGRAARNDVAHKGVLLPKSECLTYIDAVGRELTAWRVLTNQ